MNDTERDRFIKLWEKHKTRGWLDLLEYRFIQSMFATHNKECMKLTDGETL